ncbi:DNA polymerase III subunit chi [compost metagenome]
MAETDNDAPLLLACGADAGGEQSLLINLASSVPPFFERFARIAEVVNQDPQTREALRSSYRFYRERGYAPQHLNL